MKLGQIYKTVVAFGMANDPRGKDKIKKELSAAKKKYEALTKKDREFFDKERMGNPYSDTRVLLGKPDADIKTVLAGIDIEIGEVLLAERLGERGEKIDLLLTHHPEGSAMANFYDVMHMQVDILNKVGVPVNIAESLMDERIKEVERRVMPANHMRAVDAARYFDMAFMTCHTPADNCVTTYLQKLLDRKKPDTLDDVIGMLREIPEYKYSALNNAPPRIIKGKPSGRPGRIFVEMTGGTEGSKNIFSKLSQAGVSTLVCMHLSEEHFKKASEEHLNVIIAGHIASDNIGLNLMLDELESKARLKVLTCSGFKRFSRRK